RVAWIRAITLSVAGFIGGIFGEKIVGLFTGDSTAAVISPVNSVVDSVATPPEPLFWYRLLPNSTYSSGVVIALLVATVPLIIIGIYLLRNRVWVPSFWEATAVAVPLLAFLAVGLIASTKSGGGGDLHNLDMFLIGLVFAAIIFWQHGADRWFKQ